MNKSFDEVLDDAINDYIADQSDRRDAIEQVISALELKLMALKEEENSAD